MFSGTGGTELAARVAEWLDLHPEILRAINEEPEMVAILERYSTELRPFIQRYNSNHPPVAAEPASEVELTVLTAAEPDAAQAARIVELESLVRTHEDDCKRLSGECAAAVLRADEAEAVLTPLRTERDQLAATVKTLQTEADGLRLERDEAVKKLSAVLSGQPPVSATPAADDGRAGSMWEDARKQKSRK
jgi:chromosome segregation ATPase